MENSPIQENIDEKEIINCVDKKGNIIGSVERKEGIEKGMLLQAVQLWIINPKTNEVLMQKRAKRKENDANMIDVSSSGHVRKNELPIQAVLRESFEEIGIIPSKLYPKLQDLMQIEADFTKLGRKGKYIVHQYLAFVEDSINDYKKQDEEVDELFFMNYEDVKKEIRNKNPKMRIPYINKTEELFEKIDKKIYNLNKDNLEK